LSTWRAVINCSEPVHYHSHQLFADRFARHGLRPEALVTCYAMAENVFAVTQGGIDAPVFVDEVDERALLIERRAIPTHHQTLKLLSCGPALPNVRVRVLDDERNELPDRYIGEIALQSDCLLTGYFHRPDLTAKAFHDGWYLTGDLGYVANGEVFITGRKKDLIIVGGKNVYPQDLERLAGDVPGIHPGRVVAFGVYDEEAGTEEVVVVAEAETEPDEAERERLADALRQRITRGTDVALRLAHVVGPKWLIKTSSGKIARAANREKYLAETKPMSGD
jgi:acyl-CoA synthetase (AMP-forming)/AMP-acid ligase II